MSPNKIAELVVEMDTIDWSPLVEFQNYRSVKDRKTLSLSTSVICTSGQKFPLSKDSVSHWKTLSIK